MLKQEGTATSPGTLAVTNADNEYLSGNKKMKEIFDLAKTRHTPMCPVRDIIARISDKWSMLAILALGSFGKLRFNELKHKIGDVSQRMLTVTLRNLEADGLITRKIYAEVPPRVEYELTQLGIGLMNQYSLFADWAACNGEEILKSRKKQQPQV